MVSEVLSSDLNMHHNFLNMISRIGLDHVEIMIVLQRIRIMEIKSHPWFLKNLPRELTEAAQAIYYRKENPSFSLQSDEDIMKIVEEAKTLPPASHSVGGFGWGGEEDEGKEEDEEEAEEEDVEDEYEKTVKEVHASGEVHLS
ncbi:Serine/threonine-protein kinase srk2a [Sarracenia purpurea var. burkii]